MLWIGPGYIGEKHVPLMQVVVLKIKRHYGTRWYRLSHVVIEPLKGGNGRRGVGHRNHGSRYYIDAKANISYFGISTHTYIHIFYPRTKLL